MKLLIWLTRVIGGFIGFFVLLFSLAEVLGLIPHSDETPPILQRLIASVPTLFCSIVLIIPHSLYNQGNRYKLLLASYLIVTLIVIFYASQGVLSYLSNEASWGIVLVSVLILLVPISNALALWYVHKNPKSAT